MLNEEGQLLFLNETKELKDKLEIGFLELGRRLLKIRTEELWKAEHTSFVEYCWELDMNQSKVSKLITVYQKMISEFKIPADEIASKTGGWSNAYEIANMAKNKEQALSLMDEYSLLKGEGGRQFLYQKRTGLDQTVCQHDFYLLKVCRKCNLKENQLNV